MFKERRRDGDLEEHLLSSSAAVEIDSVASSSITDVDFFDLNESTLPDRDDDDDKLDRKLDPNRWAVLIAFCLNNCLCSAIWISYAPVAAYAVDHFDAPSVDWIDWLSMTFLACFLPGSLLCSYVTSRWNFRAAVVIGSALLFVGCLFRYVGIALGRRSGYAVSFVGQTVAALGQAVFANSPAKVAATWFRDTAKATAIGATSGAVGIALGQVVAPLVVTSPNDGWRAFFGAQVVFTASSFALTIATFPDRPATPPTASEATRRAAPKPSGLDATQDLRRQVKSLLSDREYRVVLLAFGSGFAINNAVLTVLEQWVAVANYTADEAGLFGGALILGGIVGTAVVAPALDKTRRYRLFLRAGFAAASSAAVLLCFAIRPGHFVQVCLSFTLLGAMMTPLITVCFDAIAAHTYPISEEISAAGLMLTGQLLGIVFVVWMGALIEKNPTDGRILSPPNVLFLTVAVSCALIAQLFRGKDKRHDHTTTQE